MAENTKDLFDHFHQPGTIAWIGLRPQKKAAVQSVSSAEIVEGKGLVGDHYQGASGNRDVTLIQAEHLEAVGKILGKEVNPGQTRRNIVVSGVNLLALVDKTFKLGDDVILETTGLCHPCSRMEENLGYGGYNAMRGHGGITTKVIRGGKIKVGDRVEAGEDGRRKTEDRRRKTEDRRQKT
ncbi:MAG: MOSC domain-containing protein [Saprospiraceae bacterium]|nr:MOSC domain-containing protein [Saprospiraceae bacterium]